MRTTKGICAAAAVALCGLSGCFSLRSVDKVQGQGGTIAVSPSHHFKARDMALGWMIENCHPRLPAVIREGLVAGSQKDGKPEWRITYECRDSNAVTPETPAAPAAPAAPAVPATPAEPAAPATPAAPAEPAAPAAPAEPAAPAPAPTPLP